MQHLGTATWGAAFVVLSALCSADEPRAEARNSAPNADSVAVLRPGKSLEDKVTSNDPVVTTDTLREDSFGTVRGQSFRLEVSESGPYYIELKSHFFDAFLILRDSDGTVLLEDDDSSIGTHARLVITELDETTRLSVEACALHGGSGPFELLVRPGKPRLLTAEQDREARLADAREGVAVVEMARGSDHPSTAQRLSNLAIILHEQGSYEAARQLMERTLAICERVHGENHPDTATALSELAIILHDLGDIDAARPLMERALRIDEAVLGEEHPGTATDLGNLATLLYAEGQYEEARRLNERALAIHVKVHGNEHPDTATAMNNLAVVLLAQGKRDKARDLYEQALAAFEAIFGEEHPLVATNLNNLAGLCHEQGDSDAARRLFERALAILERTVGDEHPDTATVLHSLADVLHSQAKYPQARELYVRAIAIRETVYGSDHHFAATSINSLGRLHYSQGEYAPARRLLTHALATRQAMLGNEHPDTATSLDNMGQLLHTLGELDEAREYHERALAIREAALGKEHPHTAQSLDSLGRLLMDQGDYETAPRLHEQALAIYEASVGTEHPWTAANLGNLARAHHARGDLGKARQLLERALTVQISVLGDDHPTTAGTLDSLGQVSRDQGDYEESTRLHRQALAIYEARLGKEHLFTATSANNLGLLLEELGDHESALVHHERALMAFEKVLGKEHPRTAAALGNLAQTLHAQGDYEAARPLYERALAVRERALGTEHPGTAVGLHNLAEFLSAQGEYAAARPLYERALAIRESVLGEMHPLTATTLDGLAQLTRAQGDYETSRKLAERAVAIRIRILGQEHPRTAHSLNNLAIILHDQGDSATARTFLERAIAAYEATLGKEHPRTATSVNNLAVVLRHLGHTASATRLYERALAIRETALGKEHPRTATSLDNLGVFLRSQGDYERARPLHERALAIRERVLGTEHPKTLIGLNNLALHLLDTDESDTALALVQQAIDRQEVRRERLVWSLTEAERILFAKTQRFSLDTFLSISRRTTGCGRAYETLLAWKAQVFRGLGPSRGRILASLPVNDRRTVERLRDLQSRLSLELFRDEISDVDAHQKGLAELRERRQALEQEWNRSLGPRESPRRPTVLDVASALPEGSVLIDFFIHPDYQPAKREDQGRFLAPGAWTPPRLSAWILPSGATSAQHFDLGPALPIEATTRAFLETLVASRGVRIAGVSKEVSAANDELRRRLWEPLAESIGNATQIFVSPDGVLGTLPLETLQLANGSYLLENHAFVYLESAASIADAKRELRTADRSTRAPAQPPGLLCVGNVNYRGSADLDWRTTSPAANASSIHRLPRDDVRGGFLDRWPSLPATDEEARAIYELHEDRFEAAASRLLLTSREATEERLKHELPHHAVIHLATHGFFQPEGLPSMWREVKEEDGRTRLEMFGEQKHIVGLMPALLSGLVLAGANKTPAEGRDDGLLTAEEISLLDLSNAGLVVLSACETGLGKPEAGEGVLGLRRMFRQAGAKTVISSLWSVKDESTSLLMQSFYDRLWTRDKAPLEALRGAQLEMLKKNRIENDGDGLPSTWGAFVLDGDWR